MNRNLKNPNLRRLLVILLEEGLLGDRQLEDHQVGAHLQVLQVELHQLARLLLEVVVLQAVLLHPQAEAQQYL